MCVCVLCVCVCVCVMCLCVCVHAGVCVWVWGVGVGWWYCYHALWEESTLSLLVLVDPVQYLSPSNTQFLVSFIFQVMLVEFHGLLLS